MTPEELVGRRITEFRERLGITQQQLGERVGDLLGREWPRQTVSAAEKGKRAFTAAELFALAHVLDTWASRLMVPPVDAPVVTMPSGTELRGLDLTAPSRDMTYALLDSAEAALRMVNAVYEARIAADQVTLTQLAPLYEALRTMTPAASETEGAAHGDDA